MTVKASSTNRNSSRSIDWFSRRQSKKLKRKLKEGEFYSQTRATTEEEENSITKFTHAILLFLQNRMCFWGRKNIMLWHFSTYHRVFSLYFFLLTIHALNIHHLRSQTHSIHAELLTCG